MRGGIIRSFPPRGGQVFGVGLAVLMIGLMFFVNLYLLEMEIIITSTPVCGSWFHETIWRDFVNGGDLPGPA